MVAPMEIRLLMGGCDKDLLAVSALTHMKQALRLSPWRQYRLRIDIVYSIVGFCSCATMCHA